MDYLTSQKRDSQRFRGKEDHNGLKNIAACVSDSIDTGAYVNTDSAVPSVNATIDTNEPTKPTTIGPPVKGKDVLPTELEVVTAQKNEILDVAIRTADSYMKNVIINPLTRLAAAVTAGDKKEFYAAKTAMNIDEVNAAATSVFHVYSNSVRHRAAAQALVRGTIEDERIFTHRPPPNYARTEDMDALIEDAVPKDDVVGWYWDAKEDGRLYDLSDTSTEDSKGKGDKKATEA
ncbi:hypothetical protein Q9189_000487 [Teloschistes chrysophthalmus]